MNARQRKLRERRRREYEESLNREIRTRSIARSAMAISPTLSSFKNLYQGEQAVLLLRHLAGHFGKRTFVPHRAPEEICGVALTKELAHNSAELQDAQLYLLTVPWPLLVYAGFVTDVPPGSGTYEITANGWAMVESKDDDYLPL